MWFDMEFHTYSDALVGCSSLLNRQQRLRGLADDYCNVKGDHRSHSWHAREILTLSATGLQN